MQEVREVLRRWQAKQGIRQIARETGLDRKTVRRYAVQARVDRLEMAPVTEETAGAVGRGVQERPLPPPSAQWLALQRHRAQIETWLGADRPLRLIRVHELLAREGLHVGYTTLRRFAQRELGWHKRPPTVRLDDPPAGQEAQIDFGLMGTVTDGDGRTRRLWALVLTLSFSRYMFVWPTFTQTVEDVCTGLDAAWRFLGGVPKHIVLDNASSMVVHASRTDPRLNPAFLDYTTARGLFADPARVQRPQDKARVENQIAYVRERWEISFGSGADVFTHVAALATCPIWRRRARSSPGTPARDCARWPCREPAVPRYRDRRLRRRRPDSGRYPRGGRWPDPR
jgi:transposase